MDRLERLGALEAEPIVRDRLQLETVENQLSVIESFALHHILDARDKRSWSDGASVIQTDAQLLVVLKLLADTYTVILPGFQMPTLSLL